MEKELDKKCYSCREHFPAEALVKCTDRYPEVCEVCLEEGFYYCSVCEQYQDDETYHETSSRYDLEGKEHFMCNGCQYQAIEEHGDKKGISNRYAK